MRKHQVHRGDQTNKKNEIDIGMMMEQADTTYKLCWGDGWFGGGGGEGFGELTESWFAS